MIFTSIVFSLHHKLAEKGINISIGWVLNCKPFFITYASAKEMALCLCKICLSTKFLFDLLISRTKKDGDEGFDSISDFFMVDCKWQRSFNGYYQWKCSKRSCKSCKDAMPAITEMSKFWWYHYSRSVWSHSKRYNDRNSQSNTFLEIYIVETDLWVKGLAIVVENIFSWTCFSDLD